MREKNQAVRRYYDQNTRLFLSLGSSPETQNIHRALWGEGIDSLDDALNYSNELILAEAESLTKKLNLPRILIVDLGCGVGGSLFYLLQHLGGPASGIGLTISPVQARLAHKAGQARKLRNPWLILEADFLAVPLATDVELVYSVEAFIHASDPANYFSQVSRLLRPGGRLVLCDDFRNEDKTSAGSQKTTRLWLEAYQSGWQAFNLRTREQVIELARGYNLKLRHELNLTPLLRLRSLPNGLAHLLLRIGQAIPIGHAILPSMLGSMALQQCLRMRVIQYRFMVFEKGA